MNRRQWALGAGAAVAAVAGGVAWRLSEEAPPPETASLWQRRFEQPDGGTLALASLRGKPLVINFWATWCPPCVKEMPELDRFHRAFAARGWQVLGLAIDRAEPVREFLARQPVGFAVALAGLEGSTIGRELGNTTGALPFTAVIDAGGRIRQRKLGETSFAELSGWASAL